MQLRLVTLLAMVLFAGGVLAAGSFNASRSSNYRITCASDVASPAQAEALLAELDRLGMTDAAKLKQWLPANFKRFGIDADQIKKLVVVPRSKKMPAIGIILLSRPEDEAAAMATTVKSGKSNSSE